MILISEVLDRAQCVLSVSGPYQCGDHLTDSFLIDMVCFLWQTVWRNHWMLISWWYNIKVLFSTVKLCAQIFFFLLLWEFFLNFPFFRETLAHNSFIFRFYRNIAIDLSRLFMSYSTDVRAFCAEHKTRITFYPPGHPCTYLYAFSSKHSFPFNQSSRETINCVVVTHTLFVSIKC